MNFFSFITWREETWREWKEKSPILGISKGIRLDQKAPDSRDFGSNEEYGAGLLLRPNTTIFFRKNKCSKYDTW